MAREIKVRWGWLRGMYVYTIVVAGGFGLGAIFAPGLIQSIFKMPGQDPIIIGVVGSVYVAFALLSILGLRSPLQFAPVLLLQLCYKVVWFLAVLFPLLATGRCPAHAVSFVVVFATFIIGDLFAIPFSYVFAKQSGR